MRGRRPETYHLMREFGAIGNGLSFAFGVAAARRNNGRVALFEGDGSILMHIQELEMVRRHGLKLLLVVYNDGAFGSEIHKLRADGVDDSGSVFGRTDLAAIARGFGLRGATVTELSQLAPLYDAFAAQPDTELWNIHVSDLVVNPSVRRGVSRGHGKL
jgi:thiamine pyrophosphate-dependent acetolactate synthase large subunit-like protein